MKMGIRREEVGGRVVYRSVNEADVNLKCQIGTSSLGWGGRRKPVMAFGPRTPAPGPSQFRLRLEEEFRLREGIHDYGYVYESFGLWMNSRE